MTRRWFDIETRDVGTEAQLYSEYLASKSGDPYDEEGHRDLTFAQYIRLCSTAENGTLEPLPA